MELSRSNAAKLADLLPGEVLAKLQEVGKSRFYRDSALIPTRQTSRQHQQNLEYTPANRRTRTAK